MRRLDGITTSLFLFSFPKHGSRFTAIWGLILIVLFFLAGCTSQRGMVSETDYLSLLPEDADMYLRFPVQDNVHFASQLITTFEPQMEAQDAQKLTKRFDTIYGAVKGKEFSAIATGSFPKLGLGFALKEKNGWKKIKDSAIPVTGSFYQYRNLPFQVAFPSSSLLMLSPQVDSLLTTYQQQLEGNFIAAENPLAQFVSEHEQVFTENATSANSSSAGTSIDFYIPDVVAVVLPLIKVTLPINLPLTNLYGSFIPQADSDTAEEGQYAFVGYLGLSDPRALKPALTVLKLVTRGLGLDLTYSSLGESTIKISGVTLSESVLGDLLQQALR